MAGQAAAGLDEARREPIARFLKARLTDARAAERAAQAEVAAKAKLESAKRLSAVEKSIGEGQYGLEDLERDTQAGLFEGHPDAASRLSAAIETARTDKHAKTEAAARGAEAFAGGSPLDAANPEHVAAIDAWWEANPDKAPAGAIEAAKRTGILPGPARDAIADGLLYGTPEKRAEQARALAELIKAAPAAAETLPPQLRAEATRIAKRLEQGHTPESATEGTDKALEGVGNVVLAGGPAGDLLYDIMKGSGKGEPQQDDRVGATSPLNHSDFIHLTPAGVDAEQSQETRKYMIAPNAVQEGIEISNQDRSTSASAIWAQNKSPVKLTVTATIRLAGRTVRKTIPVVERLAPGRSVFIPWTKFDKDLDVLRGQAHVTLTVKNDGPYHTQISIPGQKRQTEKPNR